MKHQKTIILLVVFTLLAFLPGLISFFTQSTSAQINKSQIATIKNKITQPSSRIKKKISGADKPNEIPDNVAYELFLRTVAEGNARGLVRSAGFNDEDVERIMSDANLLNDRMILLDRQAREIKGKNRDALSLQKKAELAELQRLKDEQISETVNRNLLKRLSDAGKDKMRQFIKARVKSNIQKILLVNDRQTNNVAFNKSFAKSFAKRQFGNGGQLYLYSAAWNDELDVYGSGSLSEQYSSNTSYRVTTTVTSPGGRSNMTAGDWNYATVLNDTGLSIGAEDGTYTIQADFEEQSGYYDEYGSFYGTGSSFVGSSTSSVVAPPTIRLTQILPPSQTLYVPSSDPNTSNLPTSQLFNVAVSASSGVQNPTNVVVEFIERSVVPAQPRPRATRDAITKPVTITAAGDVAFVPFTVTVDSASPAGTIIYEANIVSVTPPQGQPTPMTSGAPTTTVTIATAPTPTPTPTPTPAPSPSPSPVATNSCNPSSILIGWCYAGGGIWLYPPPSNQCRCSERIEKSPILIDTQGNGFAMTNAANGISFDLLGFGFPIQLSWTAPNSDDAWLALDRNQNNRIDNGKELFGNATQQPVPPQGEERQGFLALAEFDKLENGGNADGKITRNDAVFKKLRLWQDRNHNGVSEAEELSRLPALDVVAVFLDYKESRRTDEFGNRFKYRAKIRDARGARAGRWAWDVFLVTEP